MSQPGLDQLRDSIADTVRRSVVGRRGAERQRAMLAADGPRWFEPGRPIREVHADVAMFVGGLRALLVQSLHPLAMAGVADHSDYRHDPWGRLHRTADFVGTVTYGTAEQAASACATVKAVHRRVTGVARDGRPYAANDPHLMAWVHLAEVDSFLAAHDRYGSRRLTRDERDGYVTDMARVARELDIVDAPTDVAGLRRQLDAYRSELRGTPEARRAARFLLAPPMPLAARGPYAIIAAAAVGLMPWWTRLPLGLPFLPMTETFAVRPAGQAVMATLRWALEPTSPTAAAAAQGSTPVRVKAG